MAKLIEADTRLGAWMQAADHLLEYGPMLNLTLAIESPMTGGSNRAIDKFLADENQFPMHTVAEWIFPGVEYRRRGLRGVLDFYPEKVYPAIKKGVALLHRRFSAHFTGVSPRSSPVRRGFRRDSAKPPPPTRLFG